MSRDRQDPEIARRVVALLRRRGPLKMGAICRGTGYTPSVVETTVRTTAEIRIRRVIGAKLYYVEGSRDTEAKGRPRTKTRPKGPVGH